MCPMNCHPTLCGMKAEVKEGKLVHIQGDEGNPDSQGFSAYEAEQLRKLLVMTNDCYTPRSGLAGVARLATCELG